MSARLESRRERASGVATGRGGGGRQRGRALLGLLAVLSSLTAAGAVQDAPVVAGPAQGGRVGVDVAPDAGSAPGPVTAPRPGRYFLRDARAEEGASSALRAGQRLLQDAQAEAVMRRAAVRYAAVSSFCARFEQVLEVPLLRDTTVARGSLCQARPDSFAMRFTDPPGDALVADGEVFWVYYPSSAPGQVLVFDLEERPGGLDLYREFLESPEEKYELTFLGPDAVRGRAADHIRARPRSDRGFREAELWIDRESALIVKARVDMPNESVRTVTLTDIRLDPPPDPERFRFRPPPGVQVIRRR